MTPTRATADFDAILALIRQAFAHMEGRINPPSSLHTLTAEALAQQEVWVIGAPPVACAVFTPKPDTLYIGKLAVAPDMQRRGLARALIGAAEARARALHLPALELQTRVELTENHATFRAMGFVQTAATAHEGFDRPTSLTFRKTLRA